MPNANSTTKEMNAWRSSYRAMLSSKKRNQEICSKPEKIQILQAPKEITILDMCCGDGEYLEELYRQGYPHLWGVDLLQESLPLSKVALIHADARKTSLPSESFDWILLIHSLHHLGGLDEITSFQEECWRLLKKGGKLSIIDFKRSLPIMLAFGILRHNLFGWNKYLHHFSQILQQEWHFIKLYLQAWPLIEKSWQQQKFTVISQKQELFYFYWTLQK